MKQLNPIIVFLLCGIVMLPASFAGPVIALSNLYTAHQAEAWPTTSGIVTESRWTYGRKSAHIIHFKYNYTVDDRQYTGERYVFHSRAEYGDRQTDKIVAENPAGSQVTVHYLPQDPSMSVILPSKISSGLWLAFWFSLPFGLVTLFLMFGAWINLTKTPEQRAKVQAQWDQVNAIRDRLNSNQPVDFSTLPGSGDVSSDSDRAYVRSMINRIRIVIFLITVGMIGLLIYFR